MKLTLIATLGVLSGSASGLVHREYIARDHELFVVGAPKPTANSSCRYNASRFTGVGWIETDTRKMVSLISPEHVLFSKHFAPAIGQKVQFLNQRGEVKSFAITAIEDVPAAATLSSDLIIATLDSAVQPADGIDILTYFSPADSVSLNGKNLTIVAQHGRIGSSKISNVSPISIAQIGSIQALTFNFYKSGEPNDCRLDFGDSGGPSFIDEQDRLALVGIHCAVVQDVERSFYQSIDSFVPAYVPGINSILSRSAYRMRPYTATSTQLTASMTPLKVRNDSSKAILAELQIQNNGVMDAGNIELRLVFESGKTPTQIMGNGWLVVQLSENIFSLRREALAKTTSETLQLLWDASSHIEQLQLEMTLESDATSPLLSALNVGPWLPSPVAAALKIGAPLLKLAEAATSDPSLLDDDNDGLSNFVESVFTWTDPATPSFGSDDLSNAVVKFSQAKGSYFGSVFDRWGTPRMSAIFILTAGGAFNFKIHQIDGDRILRGMLDQQGSYAQAIKNMPGLLHGDFSLEALSSNHYALRGKMLTDSGDMLYLELLPAIFSKATPCPYAGSLAISIVGDQNDEKSRTRIESKLHINNLGQFICQSILPTGIRASYSSVIVERHLLPLNLRGVQAKTKTITGLQGTIGIITDAKTPFASGKLRLCQLTQKPKQPMEKTEQLCSVQ